MCDKLCVYILICKMSILADTLKLPVRQYIISPLTRRLMMNLQTVYRGVANRLQPEIVYFSFYTRLNLKTHFYRYFIV